MQKQPKRKLRLEYRQYDLDPDFPVRALLLDRFVFPRAQLNALTYMHLHNCIELGYCCTGSNTLVVEDEDERCTMPGDISVLCPFAMHASYSTPQQQAMEENQWEYLYVDLPQLFRDFYPSGFPSQELLTHHSPHFPNVITPQHSPRLTQLLRDILNEMRCEQPYHREAVKGMLLVFFIELVRLVEEKARPMLKYNQILTVAPAITYISEHYNEHISPTLMAELCHMSVTHFRRTFKNVMGQTPVDYITGIRIRNSCRLLYETELPILEIAMQVGYNSISSFNRNFSELMETTPTKWRNEKRQIPKLDMIFSIFEG